MKRATLLFLLFIVAPSLLSGQGGSSEGYQPGGASQALRLLNRFTSLGFCHIPEGGLGRRRRSASDSSTTTVSTGRGSAGVRAEVSRRTDHGFESGHPGPGGELRRPPPSPPEPSGLPPASLLRREEVPLPPTLGPAGLRGRYHRRRGPLPGEASPERDPLRGRRPLQGDPGGFLRSSSTPDRRLSLFGEPLHGPSAREGPEPEYPLREGLSQDSSALPSR